MPDISRWTFTGAGQTYTVPINPSAMTGLFPERSLTATPTLAPTGRTLVYEGARPATSWQFTGDILDSAHYEALRHWVYDINQRITITDHFGRRIVCVLQSFSPEPKRAVGKAWRHTYTVKALVLSVSAPVVL